MAEEAAGGVHSDPDVVEIFKQDITQIYKDCLSKCQMLDEFEEDPCKITLHTNESGQSHWHVHVPKAIRGMNEGTEEAQANWKKFAVVFEEKLHERVDTDIYSVQNGVLTSGAVALGTLYTQLCKNIKIAKNYAEDRSSEADNCFDVSKAGIRAENNQYHYAEMAQHVLMPEEPQLWYKASRNTKIKKEYGEPERGPNQQQVLLHIENDVGTDIKTAILTVRKILGDKLFQKTASGEVFCPVALEVMEQFDAAMGIKTEPKKVLPNSPAAKLYDAVGIAAASMDDGAEATVESVEQELKQQGRKQKKGRVVLQKGAAKDEESSPSRRYIYEFTDPSIVAQFHKIRLQCYDSLRLVDPVHVPKVHVLAICKDRPSALAIQAKYSKAGCPTVFVASGGAVDLDCFENSPIQDKHGAQSVQEYSKAALDRSKARAYAKHINQYADCLDYQRRNTTRQGDEWDGMSNFLHVISLELWRGTSADLPGDDPRTAITTEQSKLTRLLVPASAQQLIRQCINVFSAAAPEGGMTRSAFGWLNAVLQLKAEMKPWFGDSPTEEERQLYAKNLWANYVHEVIIPSSRQLSPGAAVSGLHTKPHSHRLLEAYNLNKFGRKSLEMELLYCTSNLHHTFPDVFTEEDMELLSSVRSRLQQAVVSTYPDFSHLFTDARAGEPQGISLVRTSMVKSALYAAHSKILQRQQFLDIFPGNDQNTVRETIIVANQLYKEVQKCTTRQELVSAYGTWIEPMGEAIAHLNPVLGPKFPFKNDDIQDYVVTTIMKTLIAHFLSLDDVLYGTKGCLSENAFLDTVRMRLLGIDTSDAHALMRATWMDTLSKEDKEKLDVYNKILAECLSVA